MEDFFAKTRGVLFDLDGVIHVGDEVLPGANRTLRHLNEKGIPYRFVTNTTTKSADNLRTKLSAMGLDVSTSAILTTHEVAVDYLAETGSPSCFLLVHDDLRGAYDRFPADDVSPDFVVIGDIGDRWNYEILNRVFNMVMNGSKMLALHRGRYWQTEEGLRMDIGVFVSGLEFATGTRAAVIGKPSATFFEMGLRRLGVDKSVAIMVGDDIESDVGGAQAAGIRGVLVRTGKFREDDLVRSKIRPDAVIDSVADLARLI